MSYQFLQYIPPRSSYTPAQGDRIQLKRQEETWPQRKPAVLTLTAGPTAPSDPSSSTTTSRSLLVSAPKEITKIHASSPPLHMRQPTLTGTALRPRPIPNSYWATPLLIACEYPFTPANPHKPKLDALLQAGVRTFIDLTEDGELVPYDTLLSTRCQLLSIDEEDVEYHRFPIRDRSLPSSPSQIRAILATLHSNALRGRIAAVHCRGGIGRTGLVIGCWLVESGVARDGEEALQIIAKEWKGVEKCVRYPNSPETGAQYEFVWGFCGRKGKGGRSANAA